MPRARVLLHRARALPDSNNHACVICVFLKRFASILPLRACDAQVKKKKKTTSHMHAGNDTDANSVSNVEDDRIIRNACRYYSPWIPCPTFAHGTRALSWQLHRARAPLDSNKHFAGTETIRRVKSPMEPATSPTRE